MRFIYSLFFYLLTPYLLIRLWWKGKKLPAYRQRIRERFGLQADDSTNFDIWIHAVSLGEVIAATPLIEALLKTNKTVLITTMTPTGAERVMKVFGTRVVHRYIPYDLPAALKRFFKLYKPHIGLIMETELWPNLIHQAAQAGVILLLINARLSERSSRGYQKIKWLIKPVVKKFYRIFTQAEVDAARFIKLGADKEQLIVAGSIKFDQPTPAIESNLCNYLKAKWQEKRPVIILASTHENEEEQILRRLRQLQQQIPQVMVLIAPRHPERFEKVYQISKQLGFNTARRSLEETINYTSEVLIIDSLGELLSFYQLSDYAFIGGSLVPVGGHNVLEPIAMQVPVISGRHVHNSATLFAELISAKAVIIAADADELIEQLINLHLDQIKRKNQIENAVNYLNRHKGVVDNYLHFLNTLK